MKNSIVWKNDGWTIVQEADAQKHILEISIYAENGKVTEARIRHNDGEEEKGKIFYNGENALPIALDDFKKLYTDGKLEIK